MMTANKKLIIERFLFYIQILNEAMKKSEKMIIMKHNEEKNNNERNNDNKMQ